MVILDQFITFSEIEFKITWKCITILSSIIYFTVNIYIGDHMILMLAVVINDFFNLIFPSIVQLKIWYHYRTQKRYLFIQLNVISKNVLFSKSSFSQNFYYGDFLVPNKWRSMWVKLNLNWRIIEIDNTS